MFCGVEFLFCCVDFFKNIGALFVCLEVPGCMLILVFFYCDNVPSFFLLFFPVFVVQSISVDLSGCVSVSLPLIELSEFPRASFWDIFAVKKPSKSATEMFFKELKRLILCNYDFSSLLRVSRHY